MPGVSDVSTQVVPRRARLSAVEWALIALEVALGLGGVAVGVALFTVPDGSVMHQPLSMLHQTPFTTFRVPGLVLFAGLGVFPLAVAAGTAAHVRPTLAPHLAVGLGVLLTVTAHIAFFGFSSVFQGLSIALGVAICVLAGNQLWWQPTSARVPSKP